MLAYNNVLTFQQFLKLLGVVDQTVEGSEKLKVAQKEASKVLASSGT